MEKRIIIGRGTDSDITIPDETDNVSRHHLVISFNIFGKMKISDTSSNGTFINDNRMLKGSSVPVTRNDKIRLGAQWELDWNLVIDPFCKIRKAIIACYQLLFIANISLQWLYSCLTICLGYCSTFLLSCHLRIACLPFHLFPSTYSERFLAIFPFLHLCQTAYVRHFQHLFVHLLAQHALLNLRSTVHP